MSFTSPPEYPRVSSTAAHWAACSRYVTAHHTAAIPVCLGPRGPVAIVLVPWASRLAPTSWRVAIWHGHAHRAELRRADRLAAVEAARAWLADRARARAAVEPAPPITRRPRGAPEIGGPATREVVAGTRRSRRDVERGGAS